MPKDHADLHVERWRDHWIDITFDDEVEAMTVRIGTLDRFFTRAKQAALSDVGLQDFEYDTLHRLMIRDTPGRASPGDLARDLSDRPAWIRGLDHRVDAHGMGLRDLTVSPSTRLAGEKAGVANAKVDFAELHAPFTHQELIITEALGLGDDVVINPSGGPLAANPVMAAGLIRLGEAA